MDDFLCAVPGALGGRHLDWDGCFNVRDLGGIPVAGGGVIPRGVVVRSDSPERLSAAGWSAMVAHGVRTIVDLRDDDELQGDLSPRPEGLEVVRVPLDDSGDVAFWAYVRANGLDGTPLYYRLFLERKPERCAAAVAAVACARPGGVLVHCGLGRDRTGLIVLLLLALAGAAPEDVAADYELSGERLLSLFTVLRIDTDLQAVRDILVRKQATARAAVLATLRGFDAWAYLRGAGLPEEALVAVRRRLGAPAVPGPLPSPGGRPR